MPDELVVVENLEKKFEVTSRGLTRSKRFVNAVSGVSFKIRNGETFSLVGETGSGKTTVGRLVLRLEEPTRGKVIFDGQNIFKLDRKRLKEFRRNAQMIFQDPYASLNPRQTIEHIVGLPLKVHGSLNETERREKVLELLEKVGVTPAEIAITRNPHEFSGGQRQRIGIARALALNPRFVVADEPIASLDVSIRAQILNLLLDLKEEFKLTYLLIAHDLNVVKYISDRVMVMYLGNCVEIAGTDELFENPKHPYTQALMDAIPIPDPHLKIMKVGLKGEMPSPIDPPSGCTFHTRCPNATTRCVKEKPILMDIGGEHYVACHNVN